MFAQKLSEHSKEFEKQQKRIKQLKSSGKSTKDAVCFHSYIWLEHRSAFYELYNKLYIHKMFSYTIH